MSDWIWKVVPRGNGGGVMGGFQELVCLAPAEKTRFQTEKTCFKSGLAAAEASGRQE